MIGTADAAARVPMPIAGDSREDTNGPRTNPPDHAPVLLDAFAHANNHPVSVLSRAIRLGRSMIYRALLSDARPRSLDPMP